MSPKKKKEVPSSEEYSEQTADKTVFTQVSAEYTKDEKAFILFLSGNLQGKLFCLEQDETVIGRAEDATISIHDQRISRYHFKIMFEMGKAVLEDAGSTNGTFVNGNRVQRHVLENGDQIQISTSTVIKFGYGDEGERMFLSEFYRMANFDAVTGAYNKHAFEKRLEEEVVLATRTKQELSLIMLDLDYFKKVNDTYGHLAGDFILAEIVKSIQSTMREWDILARYGGEEFVVLLRGVDGVGAAKLADRLRKNVQDAKFIFEGTQIPVTISLGVSQVGGNIKSSKQLIAIADECLYASKKNGRNKVTIKKTSKKK